MAVDKTKLRDTNGVYQFNDQYTNELVRQIDANETNITTNATNITTNATNITNMKNVTDKFSIRAGGNISANSGIVYAGIAVSTSGINAQSVYLVTFWIQTSGNAWISIHSLAFLYWNGSSFASRGITEMGRTSFTTDVLSGASIRYSNGRFEVPIPNLTVDCNWACSYIRLL